MGEDAKTFRERALHARLGAKEARTAQHREIFESLAISYESMAVSYTHLTLPTIYSV